MGVTVRQKIKGKGKSWWVFISHNGKRTSRKVGTKDAAKEVAKQIEAKLQLGEFGFEQEKPVPTFQEYADSCPNYRVDPVIEAKYAPTEEDREKCAELGRNMAKEIVKEGPAKEC